MRILYQARGFGNGVSTHSINRCNNFDGSPPRLGERYCSSYRIFASDLLDDGVCMPVPLKPPLKCNLNARPERRRRIFWRVPAEIAWSCMNRRRAVSEIRWGNQALNKCTSANLQVICSAWPLNSFTACLSTAAADCSSLSAVYDGIARSEIAHIAMTNARVWHHCQWKTQKDKVIAKRSLRDALRGCVRPHAKLCSHPVCNLNSH